MPRWWTSLCVVIVLGSSAAAVDVVVVCPQQFRKSAQAWIEYRKSDSLDIAVIDSAPNVQSLTRNVRAAATDKTRYVVLMGDAPTFGNRCDPARQVPTHYLRTTVTGKWGSTPTLPTDLPFGDLNDDGAPDACVGRLPIQRAADLETMTARIKAYEQSRDFGPWRGQVHLVGGVGGFGAMADAAIESVTRTVVTSVLPSEAKTNIVYASPGHLFYPKGDSFTDSVIEQYQTGCRFWVYAGHGNITELDRVPQTRDGIPVLDRKSILRLKRPAAAAPIGLVLACYTGAVDAPDDCLVERMVVQEGGPIAVLAGSRVTMPYGNATATVGLIKGVYEENHPTLGAAWLSSLKSMHEEDPKDKSTTRVMIDAIAAFVSPAGTKLLDERHEHMGLYNLFGDPMLKLQQPLNASIEVAAGFDAGKPISVVVKSPIDGELTLALDRPLGAVSQGDPNQTNLETIKKSVTANKNSTATFQLSESIHGPVVIRAIVGGEKRWATGAAKSQIRKAKPATNQ